MRDSRPSNGPTSGSVQLQITGWHKSRAASNDDKGVSALVTFLEKRAAISQRKHKKAGKGIQKQGPVRIRKVRHILV